MFAARKSSLDTSAGCFPSATVHTVDKFRSAFLSKYATLLWLLAKDLLYRDVFLTEWQEYNAIELLKKWYEPVESSRLPEVHKMYIARVGLARKYIDRDPSRRYVQLPHLYFDPQNPSGFTGTKKWHQEHRIRKKEVRCKLILHAQIRRFRENLLKDTAAQQPPLKLFKDCVQRITALGKPELLQAFYEAIAPPEIIHLIHQTNDYEPRTTSERNPQFLQAVKRH